MTSEDVPEGRIAYCAPGNEMLAALTCALFGERIDEVRAHAWLTGDDLFVADLGQEPPRPYRLAPPRLAFGPYVGILSEEGRRDRERHEAAMAAEIADRAEWIAGVKHRLGLVCAGDDAAESTYWRMKASACHAFDACAMDDDCPFVATCSWAERRPGLWGSRD